MPAGQVQRCKCLGFVSLTIGNSCSCRSAGFRVHAGMLASARWLAGPGGAEETFRALHAQLGYRAVLTGHSLGAGVAVLLALLLKEAIPALDVRVWGFSVPACVDAFLARQNVFGGALFTHLG